MKFRLVVEYNVLSTIDTELLAGLSDDRLMQAHQEVFENNPGLFVDYLFSKKESDIKYEFVPMEEEENEGFFGCEEYYYHADFPSYICLKYGALCCYQLCENIRGK